jgi:hypothetical protein
MASFQYLKPGSLRLLLHSLQQRPTSEPSTAGCSSANACEALENKPWWKKHQWKLLGLGLFLLFNCDIVGDMQLSFRGPLSVTIITADGNIPEHPFVINSYYAVSGGHGAGPDMGYEYQKLAYAGEPVRFPISYVDLVFPNSAATIGFTVYHAGYWSAVRRFGVKPTWPWEPVKIEITVKSVEQVVEIMTVKAQKYVAIINEHGKDHPDYESNRSLYTMRRNEFGQGIKHHLSSTVKHYLPKLPADMRASVVEHYHPIHEALYYSIGETDCDWTCDWNYFKGLIPTLVEPEARRYEYDGI